MHGGRTWGGSGCDSVYNKIDNGTWKVIAYYGAPPACNPPSGLALDSVNTTEAWLSWTQVELKLLGM